MSLKLSVVIPCYNEQERFENGINHFLNYLKKQKYHWEIILVNDGSKDNTLKLIKEMAYANTNVQFVNYNINHGKGFAIATGVERAKGEIILFSDLDHAVPIETINKFFKYFKNNIPMVIGSRRVKGSILLKRQHPLRELLGIGFTLLVKLLIDFKIKDATCGFKAFNYKIAKNIFSKITIFDWAFDAELLYLCKIYNINYVQAPVDWTDVKGSKVSLFKDVIKSFFGLIKIRLNDFSKKYK